VKKYRLRRGVVKDTIYRELELVKPSIILELAPELPI